MPKKIPEILLKLFDALAVDEGLGYDPGKVCCSTCKHRRNVMGSAHSECHAISDLGLRLQCVVTGPPTANTQLGPILIVYGDPAMVAKGYFTWPVNFDPTWLWWCMLWEEKEEDENQI